MRRRRQKNNLLPKMIGIAVVLNAILLPILAKLGVFKAGRSSFMRVTEIKLPPEKKPPVPKKTPPKKRVAKAKSRPASRRQATRPATVRPSRPNPNQPKVVASAPGGKSGGGPAIENNGTAAPGQVATPGPPATNTIAAPPVTPPLPPSKPAEPIAAAPPPPPPHEPVLTEAEPLAEPRPVVPDDLRDLNLPMTLRALFTVHPDGTVSVKMTESTGNAALDQLALDAARRWTFRPATRDGKPIESYRRLAVVFETAS